MLEFKCKKIYEKVLPLLFQRGSSPVLQRVRERNNLILQFVLIAKINTIIKERRKRRREEDVEEGSRLVRAQMQISLMDSGGQLVWY